MIELISGPKFPVPAGSVQLTPHGEMGTMILRVSCIDGVLIVPVDVPIITLEGEASYKWKAVVIGVFGGKQLSIPIDDEIEDFLLRLHDQGWGGSVHTPQLAPPPISEDKIAAAKRVN